MARAAAEVIAEIQDLFLEDSIPWVIGYSGGKDSTASLQLIWQSLSELPEDKRQFKKVYVISTDTLVENPVISVWVRSSLAKMGKAAAHQGLPIEAHQLTPSLENRFWVNLIGKGYAAPRRLFRWCTDRLKIAASTKFIQELSEANGEAILVLGQRRGESQARDRVMDRYQTSTRERLSRNKDPKLSRVWVYLPIETWTSDDVWEYLIESANPWGADNQELFDLYRGATADAECPIVVDKTTPSCGDSRFGCYVCTMVSQDKSMQAMIHNDAAKAWMQPILDFRDNFLAVPDHDFREFRRMRGNITWDKGKLVPGPYTQARRAELLRELLATQEAVRKTPGFEDLELIGLDELEEIRRIWVKEKGEFEDRLPSIYEAATGRAYTGRDVERMPLGRDDLRLLREVASEFVRDNLPESEDERGERRSEEMFKMVRSLLAASFQSETQRKRSVQLDRMEKLLKDYAFLDKEEAVAFAMEYLGGAADAELGEATEDWETEVPLREDREDGAHSIEPSTPGGAASMDGTTEVRSAPVKTSNHETNSLQADWVAELA